MFIIVGYEWCTHYHHAKLLLESIAPTSLIAVTKRGSVGKKELLANIHILTTGKTVIGKAVGDTSPQVFVRYPDLIYCLGGDDDVTQNKRLIQRYFI